ncbi:hypothetical protein A9Q99_05415 [Gammaproteobacteria bacterium 45_16_T64]|nr:hypothetical protein A9Q99_05415 [Gammaproteobacteria bacterium 45_16_T64]
MSLVYFDVGNTRAKWSLVDGGESVFGVLSLGSESPDVEAMLAITRTARKVMISSVKDPCAIVQLTTAISEAWGVEASFACTRPEQRGLICSYEDPSRLGVDRWLAMLAGRDRVAGAFCVIDCGSAVTIDVVASDGAHIGGYILPGLQLGVSALLGGTDQVIVDCDNFAIASLEFGRNTTDAVYNGALFGLKSSVEAALSQALLVVDTGPCSLLLTGGDGALLSGLIHPESVYIENLVLDGLKLYFDSE